MRFTLQQTDLSLARARELPAVEEQRDLLLPPHHRCHLAACSRFEPALRLAAAHHAPHAGGLGDALHTLQPAVFVVERAGYERSGAIAHDHLARLGQRLHALRQIWRLAHCALLRGQDV